MSGSERVVLVDMDNTVVHYDAEFAKRYQEMRPDDDVEELIFKRKHFEIEKNFEESVQGVVAKVMHAEDFFIKLKAFEGAIEALREMQLAGLEVYLCTSPSTFQYEASSAKKYAWVRENLGEDWMARLVITRDKSIVKGRVIIDDKPSIKGACSTPEWTHIIFEQPYNLEVTDKPRMTRWCDWKQILAPYYPELLSN